MKPVIYRISAYILGLAWLLTILSNLAPGADHFRLHYGAPTSVTFSLDSLKAVGQAFFLPQAKVDRIEITPATYRRTTDGFLVVDVLSGPARPDNIEDVENRRIARRMIDGREIKDSRSLIVDLSPTRLKGKGEGYYLFVWRIPGGEGKPLSLWLSGPNDAKIKDKADLIVFGDEFSYSQADSHLVLALGLVQSNWLRGYLNLGPWALYILVLAALAGLAVFIKWGPVPDPNNPAKPDRYKLPYDYLSWAFLALALVVVTATFRDYGVTLDEEIHLVYGRKIVEFFRSGFSDWSVNHYRDLMYYGGLFDGLAAWAADNISPFNYLQTKHLLNGLAGLAGLVACFKLAKFLAGERAGFLAVIILALTPTYYGHAFNNFKDFTFAAGYIWSVYYLVRLIKNLPAPPWPLVLKFGLAVGLTGGIRVGGLVVLAYLGLLAGLTWLDFVIRAKNPKASLAWLGRSIYRTGLPALAVSWTVMSLCWPFALADPLKNPLAALSAMTHLKHVVMALHKGLYYPADQVPWDYLPHHLLVKLPELFIFLLAAATLIGLAWLFKPAGDRPRAWGWAAVALAFTFPVVYVIVSDSTLYDGIRHFIFVIPPLAVTAGAAFDHVLAKLGQIPRPVRTAVGAALVLYAGYHLFILFKLHPYQYIYYNQLVGGPAGAYGRYELDYWAASTEEAVGQLDRRLKNEYGDDYGGRKFYLRPGNILITEYPNFQMLGDKRKAHFVIANTRWNQQTKIDGKKMLVIQRMGAPLTYVIDRRGLVK